jgi:excisionase family DNA binding protein
MTVNYRKATKYAASLTPEQSLSTGSQLQPPLLVPVREAARLLSVSPWEIRRLCRRGALGYRKLGRTKWLIKMRSIQAFASEVER